MSKAQFLAENLKDGEIYAGIILGKCGERDYHLVILPSKPKKKMIFSEAIEWAKSVNGDLPTYREQSLLFANCKEHFDNSWYWSNTQYGRYEFYAWGQSLPSGEQSPNSKLNENSARAVLRIYIQE